MFRLLRRSACAGLAGLALGLMPPALSAAPEMPGAIVAAPTTEQQAARVELAWMSDSRVFTLSLEARANGEGVVISGKVPDEAMHRYVLRLARQASCASIVDRLSVEEKLQTVSDETAALRLAAIALVRTKLGDRATAVKVLTGEDGVVELHGKVSSLQERLDASRCLRGLPGCTRVENYLITTGDAGDPKQLVPVSALAAPPAAPPAAPELPAPREVSVPPQYAPTGPGALSGPQTAPTLMPPPFVPTTTYVYVPTRVVPVDPAPRPVVQPQVTGYVQPPPGNLPFTGCVVTSQGVQLNVAQHVPPPTLLDKLRIALGLKQKRQYAAPVPTEAPPLAQPSYPTVQPLVQSGGQAKAPGTLYIPKSAQAPMPAGPQSLPVAVGSWPPAHRLEGDVAEFRMPPTPKTQPVATFGSAPQALPAPPAVPVPTLRPSVADAPNHTQALLSPPHPATARQMVLGQCGKLVRSVEANLDHENKLTLHVYSAPGAEQELKKKLTQAFAGYGGMHIQIHMAQ
jgi:osmotically-inducible protein OsmY